MTESVLYHEGNRRLQDPPTAGAPRLQSDQSLRRQDFIPVAAPPTS